MTKRELFVLLQSISLYYEQFDVNQEKIDAWYLVLQREDVDCVKEKLMTMKKTIDPLSVMEHMGYEQLEKIAVGTVTLKFKKESGKFF